MSHGHPTTRLERLFADAPVNGFLGFELVRVDADGAELRLPVRSEFVQEGGVVHGGVLTALADTAAVYALLAELPEDRMLTGIELKLNFLRSVRPENGTLHAVARPLRRGHRLGVVRVELRQSEVGVAEGLFTYLFYE